MTKSLLLIGMLALAGCFISCNNDDDDAPAPTFTAEAPAISADQYTAPENLAVVFSRSAGGQFVADLPAELMQGDTVYAKVIRGEKEVLPEDFTIDWSASNPAPVMVDGNIAAFVVGVENPAIAVSVSDIYRMLVINRNEGATYEVDRSTGVATFAFSITHIGQPLANLRSLVYHPANGLFYATTTENGNGRVFSINPQTKSATVINNNAEDTWDGLADIIITNDDSLMVTGYVNGLSSQALIKIGYDGTLGSIKELTFEPATDSSASYSHCCGMGLTYGPDANTLYIGDDSNYLITSNLEGIYSDPVQLALDPDLINTEVNDLYIMNMATDENGTIYGLLYDTDYSRTYIAVIDPVNNTTKIVSNLNTVRHNGLAIVPAYTY